MLFHSTLPLYTQDRFDISLVWDGIWTSYIALKSQYGRPPLEYIVPKVQVQFPHCLLRGGWLWVRHDVSLLWDYMCLFYSIRILPVFAVGATLSIYVKYIIWRKHKQNLTKIHVDFKHEWGLKEKYYSDEVIGVTYVSLLVATQWPLKRAPGLCGMDIMHEAWWVRTTPPFGFYPSQHRRCPHLRGNTWSGLGALNQTGHGWSPPRIIFKMARGLVKFWKVLNHNST